MLRNYDHILSLALESPWALTRPMVSVIAEIIALRLAGGTADTETVQAALVNRKNLPQPKVGSIAIIPIYGVIAPRMNLVSEMSGGTTFEKLTGQLHEAMNEKTVKTIVLDVDSGGGNVMGATEFARELMKARAKKPIVAVAQYSMGSAAYWAASGATEIVASPSARIGSIGVYTMHDDLSEARAKIGIKRTFISAGEGKVEGNDNEPLSDETLARVKALIGAAYGHMVNDIVKGRGQGMTADRVKGEWKALLYSAEEARANGMIDRIATLDETLSRILSGSNDPADQRAAELLPSLLTGDTSQEPARATDQDRRELATFEQQIFALALPTTTHPTSEGTP